MSLIRVECGNCQTALQVRAEMAGQQGRCPVCQAVIAIPAAGNTQDLATAPPTPASPPSSPGSSGRLSQTSAVSFDAPPTATPAPKPDSSQRLSSPPAAAPAATAVTANPALPLGQAMAPDMLAEISRRKKSAVMVIFETPASGSYEISKQPEANVRCYRTADMSDAQLMLVLEQLGHMSQGMRNLKGGIGLEAEGQPQPYELKGDRLGMTLEEFKAKYSRKVGGITLPYCSDSFPGQPNQALMAEPWYAAAGLINARIDLPSENNSPTIAGVRTDLFLYHFVDGRLYRMTALFDTEAFHLIHNALVQKQGPATRENKDKGELTWENGVSTIHLVRGAMYPKKPSRLVYFHNALQKSAEGRAPARASDL